MRPHLPLPLDLPVPLPAGVEEGPGHERRLAGQERRRAGPQRVEPGHGVGAGRVDLEEEEGGAAGPGVAEAEHARRPAAAALHARQGPRGDVGGQQRRMLRRAAGPRKDPVLGPEGGDVELDGGVWPRDAEAVGVLWSRDEQRQKRGSPLVEADGDVLRVPAAGAAAGLWDGGLLVLRGFSGALTGVPGLAVQIW